MKNNKDNLRELDKLKLTPKQKELITRKGVYPYEYIDSVDRFNETQLPPKEAFYSSLNGEGISDDDY